MPQKINGAGQMQEYVPAGNGDPSGEYADGQGANKHFANFGKKLIETEAQPTKENNSFVKNSNKTKDITSSIFERVTNRNEKTDEILSKLKDETSEEAQNMLVSYVDQNENLKMTFKPAGRWAGYASGSGLVVSNHSVHTIRHEMGHTWDCFYAKTEKNEHPEWGTLPYLSTHYIDKKEGKTLNQVLHDELGMHTTEIKISGYRFRELKTGADKRETKAAFMKKIIDEYNNYCDILFDKKAGIKNAREKVQKLKENLAKYEQEAREEWFNSDEKKEYERLNHEVYHEEEVYSKEQFKKGAWRVLYSDSPKVMAAREKRNKARELSEKKYNDILSSKGTYKKDKEEYNRLTKIRDFNLIKETEGINGVVGDLCDYTGTGHTSYPTNGHGYDYFYKTAKTTGIATEIFANLFDIHCGKDDNKKEAVKKMLPKTTAVFDRLIEKYGNGDKKNEI